MRGTRHQHRFTRREVLRLGASAAAAAAVGPFIATPGHGQTFNWQRFKGKELFCIFYKHPWIDEMVKYFPEFTDLTGIKVNYEVLPEVLGLDGVWRQLPREILGDFSQSPKKPEGGAPPPPAPKPNGRA